MVNRIFSIIGWLGTALVFGAVGIRFGIPAQEQYATYMAQAGLACMLLYIVSQWREILGFFTSRQARYGTLAASSVAIVIGILVAVNYIGKQQNRRWDLTAAKQFSLSDQSRTVVSTLDAPLEILVFAQESAFRQYRDRLREYEYASKQVKAEYIDPDKKRALAQEHKIEQYGTLIFNFKGRTERVTSDAEQEITNAIIKVVTGEQKKVYFTAGHGERDTMNSEGQGYSVLDEALKRENYGVEKVVLAQTGSVADDATAVVVAGPINDFFPAEIDALKKYLEKNGKLLLMLDPPGNLESAPLTNLIALAREWGVDVGNSVVVDASGMGRLIGTDASAPVAASYPSHPITTGFQIITAYPMTRPITPVEGGVDGRSARTFVESSPRSWAETDIQGLLTTGAVELNEDQGDKTGPVSMAVAVNMPSTQTPPPPDTHTDAPPAPRDAPKPEARLVVFGDSDFPSNGVMGIAGNKDMFMNSVGWLSQQENLISIRPKDAQDRRITLTATQQNNITWLSLLVIPGAIFGTGIFGWWRRR